MSEGARSPVAKPDRDAMALRMKDCYRGVWWVALTDGEVLQDTLKVAALNGTSDPEAPDDPVTYTFWSGRTVALGRIASIEYMGAHRA